MDPSSQQNASTHDADGNHDPGMASFDPNTPLDWSELESIGDFLEPREFICLGRNLGIGTSGKDLPIKMLQRWHSTQDPAKERRLLIEASIKSNLSKLTMILKKGTSSKLRQEPLHKPILSGRRKRNHTQTLAGHETNTPGASQPPSAPNSSFPSKQTHTQILSKHDTNTPGARQPSSATNPSCPKVRAVTNPPQQPNIVPMQKPQQTIDEITEIKLRDLSNKLGDEWRTVGTYLGLKHSEIEVMQQQYPVVKDCIFKMLLHWRNTKGVKATKKKLKKVLRRSDRADLEDFIDESDHESQ